MPTSSNLWGLNFFKGILGRFQSSSKEEVNAFPLLPEELIYLILDQFHTEELYLITPHCRQMRRLKAIILSTRPTIRCDLAKRIACLKVEIFKVEGDLSSIIKGLKVPMRAEPLHLVDYPRDISEKDFKSLKSPFIQVVDQNKGIHLSLLAKNNEGKKYAITLSPSGEKKYLRVYSSPPGAFGYRTDPNMPEIKLEISLADANIFRQVAKILLNRHDKYQLINDKDL